MNATLLFKSLADESRLLVVLLLLDKGELCVCDLQSALQISQPKMSRHLAELRKQGLLQGDRRGKWVYYRLDNALPQWVMDILQASLNSHRDWLKPFLQRVTACLSARCCSVDDVEPN